jgi:acetyltransferase-like isoleucine patch superfamily enzyme
MRYLSRVRKKCLKLTAKYFPVCAIRILALRGAGYSVGRDVYIGEELHVTDELEDRPCPLAIGDRVAIAQRVLIILSSYANNSLYREVFGVTIGRVAIARDAWVGAGAIILPNVTIGEGAVVGAGSVVTQNVAPFTIVAGNPARLIRYVEFKGRQRPAV